MIFEKASDRMCPECGEVMTLVDNYGATGEVFECRSCGFSQEIIDLRVTVLDPTDLASGGLT